MQITVIIHTYNAEKHLRRVLDSVQGFDELLVCDMESTDNTLRIAEEYGCRIITFPRREHSIVEDARDFAIRRATHAWVLEVDADELVTPELKSYLYDYIKHPDCADGVYIPRKNYFMGRFMHCHYPDHILRFFRRDVTTWPAVIHTPPIVNGRTYKIPKQRKELAFIHLANDSVSDILRKTDLYTWNELDKKKDKRYNAFAFVSRPFFRFFKAYILKGGFRDGKPGFIRAFLEGFYQFVILAKQEEDKHKPRSSSEV